MTQTDFIVYHKGQAHKYLNMDSYLADIMADSAEQCNDTYILIKKGD